ncbi:MAG: hypothetical protein WC683_18290 [bacterium]
MARGRMLNTSISKAKKFDELPDDTCRLLATWTIAHLDLNGVFYADPMLVRSVVFPRRADITLEQVEGYLAAMQSVGLIQLFEDRGEMWQWWPGFADNQPGLRRERERTDYPLPPVCRQPADNLPPKCGEMSAESKSKLNQIKVVEGVAAKIPHDNGQEPLPAEQEPPPPDKPTDEEIGMVFSAYQDTFGLIPSRAVSEDVEALIDDMAGYGGKRGAEWVLLAIQEARDHSRGAPNLAYLKKIIASWRRGATAPRNKDSPSDGKQWTDDAVKRFFKAQGVL